MGLICGILPWYCQFNEIDSTQSVGWDGVFCCPRSPSRLKDNDGTAVKVQRGVALAAVLFASVAKARVFNHLVVSPSISVLGEAHFATNEDGLSVAEIEHKGHRELYPATGGGLWRRRRNLFSMPLFPTTPSC